MLKQKGYWDAEGKETFTKGIFENNSNTSVENAFKETTLWMLILGFEINVSSSVAPSASPLSRDSILLQDL
jgi:hypothetical protein